MKHIDAHAHLNFDAFDDDREQVIANMSAAGIGAINVGVDIPTSQQSVDLAAEYRHIWASVGCHPTEVASDFSADSYAELIQNNPKQVVAVGECGLDYYRKQHRGEKEKRAQKEVFEAHIQLAVEEQLPLILHIRPREGTMDAYEDGLAILEYYSGDLSGTAHFFVGSREIADRFLDLGFYLSATGPVTFDNRLQEVFSHIPPDRLLVETDAPFAAPASHRGQRNSPLYILEIVKQLAILHDRSVEEISGQFASNTQRLFPL